MTTKKIFTISGVDVYLQNDNPEWTDYVHKLLAESLYQTHKFDLYPSHFEQVTPNKTDRHLMAESLQNQIDAGLQAVRDRIKEFTKTDKQDETLNPHDVRVDNVTKTVKECASCKYGCMTFNNFECGCSCHTKTDKQ